MDYREDFPQREIEIENGNLSILIREAGSAAEEDMDISLTSILINPISNKFISQSKNFVSQDSDQSFLFYFFFFCFFYFLALLSENKFLKNIL